LAPQLILGAFAIIFFITSLISFCPLYAPFGINTRAKNPNNTKYMTTDQCCVVSCEKPLDGAYWDAQYQANSTGWDLGTVSPPIQTY
jgi:hypothetical protein